MDQQTGKVCRSEKLCVIFLFIAIVHVHVHAHMQVYVCLSVFLQTPPLPPQSLSLCFPPSLSFPHSPLSLWDTGSDQVVLPLCSPQCGHVCCLLSICSKLEEAAELLLYIDSNNVLFVSFSMAVFMYIIKGWC